MIEALKNIWNSMIAGFRDRTTNPLTTAFIISWSIWNYKLLMIFLGNESTFEKFTAIDSLYPLESSLYQGKAFAYPVATALLYVFIYPFLSRLAIWAYRKHQISTANLVKKLEGERILNSEEAAEITRRHERERKKWDEKSMALTNELNEVRRALEAAEYEISRSSSSNENQDLPNPDSPLPAEDSYATILKNNFDLEISPPAENSTGAQIQNGDELNNDEKKLILKLSEYAYPIAGSELAASLNANFSLVDSDLKGLKNRNLIVLKDRHMKPPGWELTNAGRERAVGLMRKKI